MRFKILVQYFYNIMKNNWHNTESVRIGLQGCFSFESNVIGLRDCQVHNNCCEVVFLISGEKSVLFLDEEEELFWPSTTNKRNPTKKCTTSSSGEESTSQIRTNYGTVGLLQKRV